MMRWPTAILLALLIALQYPLWFGKGGWLHVQQSSAQLRSLQEANSKLEVRNATTAAEVQDLKSGFDALEERARFELGLVKPGEVFVQLPEEGSAPPAVSAPAARQR